MLSEKSSSPGKSGNTTCCEQTHYSRRVEDKSHKTSGLNCQLSMNFFGHFFLREKLVMFAKHAIYLKSNTDAKIR